MTPEEHALEKIARRLQDELLATIVGPACEQRMTALRVHGTTFEHVYLDDNGLVIEPIRCTCRWAVVVDFNCPLHKGGGVT